MEGLSIAEKIVGPVMGVEQLGLEYLGYAHGSVPAPEEATGDD